MGALLLRVVKVLTIEFLYIAGKFIGTYENIEGGDLVIMVILHIFIPVIETNFAPPRYLLFL